MAKSLNSNLMHATLPDLPHRFSTYDKTTICCLILRSLHDSPGFALTILVALGSLHECQVGLFHTLYLEHMQEKVSRIRDCAVIESKDAKIFPLLQIHYWPKLGSAMKKSILTDFYPSCFMLQGIPKYFYTYRKI